MRRYLLLFLGLFFLLLPRASLAAGWSLRLGVASFPEQNTLFGVEVTRLFDLTDRVDLGIGGVVRTDFSDSFGPGMIVRLRDWVAENFAIGAVTEAGYMYHRSTEDPSSYSYLFAGPLLAFRANPLFVQWEPGWLLYKGKSELQPLRLLFGFSF